MEILAKTRYLRMSSRKVRLVADVIRGMDVLPALGHLRFIVKAASKPIEKALRSAIANAEHNFQLKGEHLFVKTIQVDQGPALKRWRARAFGRAAPISKHSCHITIILDEKPGSQKTPSKKSETVQTHKEHHEGIVDPESLKHSQDMAEQIVKKQSGHKADIVDTKKMAKHHNQQHTDKKELHEK